MTDPRPTVTLGVEAPRSSAGGIVAFLVLTFAVTWSCYITAAGQSGVGPARVDPAGNHHAVPDRPGADRASRGSRGHSHLAGADSPVAGERAVLHLRCRLHGGGQAHRRGGAPPRRRGMAALLGR